MSADLRAIWPRRLWLARHGRTVLNLAGLVQGRLDPPLAPEGVGDAARVARQLAGQGVRRVISSDLRRARETAALIAQRLGVPHAIEPRLAERAWGPWEGRPRHERPPLADPPEAEPQAALARRVTEALTEAIAAGTADEALIVTHAGVIRALLAALGLETEEAIAHDRALALVGGGGQVGIVRAGGAAAGPGAAPDGATGG